MGTLSSLDDLQRYYSLDACRPTNQLSVACYYFPHFQPSALNDELYGGDWTEHLLRQAARPWFPGHRQPRTPLWGEQDESNPTVVAREIDAAADAGIGALIYDWYWYDGRPALHEALENGFLRAPNRDRMKFAVMWCPHDWPYWTHDLLPNGSLTRPAAKSGPETIQDVRRSLTYVISRYFQEPNYWQLDGKPVVVIWELARLQQLFGPGGVGDLLDDLRQVARQLGHAGIHFHASCGGSGQLIDEFAAAGFDSYGDYSSIVAVHRRVADGRPIVKYGECAAEVVEHHWSELEAASPLPYFPNIGAGWDTTPRFRAPDTWPPPCDWPGLPIVTDDTPSAFEALVRAAIGYINSRPATAPEVLTIGCFNEWTEGHYLLPDTDRGMGMLHALASALKA